MVTDAGFPFGAYRKVKANLAATRKELEKEQARWHQARTSLTPEDQALRDEQFKDTFETLGELPLDKPAADLFSTLQTLEALVRQGASAHRLGNNELGTYNLAMLVNDIANINSSDSLALISKIARLTIIADVDLNSQKAYAGNGGAVTIDWLCTYLAGGIEPMLGLRSKDQYMCCYTLLTWILKKDHPGIPGAYDVNPLTLFIACIKPSPEVKEYQQQTMLTMISQHISPFSSGDIYQSPSFFNRLAAVDVTWLGIIFPYEHDLLQPYIHAVRKSLNDKILRDLLNSFTSNNHNRKYFKTFFSRGVHWLLLHIIETTPDHIFNLVKRNEPDLLTPLLKHYRPQLTNLKDHNGDTLLHHAVRSRGRSQNTVVLLLNAKLSPHEKNNEGLTPADLARKNNKADLVKLF